MPFDDSGNFYRLLGPKQWQDARDAHIPIEALAHDTMDNDLVSGLSNTICRDGQSQILENIPFNSKKITNLGAPESPNDAARLADVQGLRDFTTGITISGIGVNGRVTFTNPPVAGGPGNGLSFYGVDKSWLIKAADPGPGYPIRLVYNSNAAGTGTDLVALDPEGTINSNSGKLTNNLAKDTAGNWRAIVGGLGTIWEAAGGMVKAWANDSNVASAMLIATMREFFRVQNNAGSVMMTLWATASGKANSIQSKVADKKRWQIDLGDGAAESAPSTGSDFRLTAFANDETQQPILLVSRSNYSSYWYKDVTVAGTFTLGSFLGSSIGTLYLRPNGVGNASGQVAINSAGTMSVDGNLFVVNGFIYGTNSIYLCGQGGNVEFRPNGIGDTSTNGFINTAGNLIIKGSIGQKASGTTWSNPSDARLKQVSGPYESGLAEIIQLKPVIYTLLAHPELGDQIGVIGQEIETVMPETIKLVEGEIDVGGEKVVVSDLRQFDANAITFALINSVKELTARIETLEAGA